MNFYKMTTTKWTFLISIFIIIVWLAYPFLLNKYGFILNGKSLPNSTTPSIGESFGTFGDSYGALNTLFSGLAFTGIVISLISTKKQFQRQAFDTHFFELVKIHRENVERMEIRRTDNTSDTGIKAIISILNEYMVIKKTIHPFLRNSSDLSDRASIAYYCLFFGVGSRGQNALTEYLKNYENLASEEMVSFLKKDHIVQSTMKEEKIKHIIFSGHQSRLGHYYRNLFYIVEYVDSRNFLTNNDKNEYLKLLRSQLTTQEQILLLLNSLTKLGENWNTKKYIEKYGLVKNIPKNYFDPGSELDLSRLFPNGYFEHDNH